MKASAVVAVIVAAATFIGSGAALAGEKKAPEPGTWEYQAALETGKLPASDAGTVRKASGPQSASVPTIKVGGVVYRVGVDTP